jgi:hypothetical protein
LLKRIFAAPVAIDVENLLVEIEAAMGYCLSADATSAIRSVLRARGLG